MSSELPSYPEKLLIEPPAEPPWTEVRVPGSKSLTNRALVLGAVAGLHTCYFPGALRSEDTEVMIAALQALGFEIAADWNATPPYVNLYHPENGLQVSKADLFVGNSGTSMRFLTALLALGHGTYRLDGVPRMRERPIQELLDALGQLGVRAVSAAGNGCPPVVIEADGLRGGQVRLRGDRSSQFLSALLMVAPFADGDTLIEVDGPLVSEPYVAMTLDMVRRCGCKCQIDVGPGARYRILGNRKRNYLGGRIEPDASAASYFWAAAAITDGSVKVQAITVKSLQGDVRFVDLLGRMGCQVIREDSGITVIGGPLRGIDADMNDISDTVMTLAAVACFAEGPTTIRNVAHIRHKETDRLAALAAELRRVGAGVDEFDDGLTITPRPLHGAEIETYNDHRIAMSMALLGLKVPGIVIKNPGCVAKTYPHFFDDLNRLR